MESNTVGSSSSTHARGKKEKFEMLRDYQEATIVKLRDSVRGGKKRPVLQLPTGGGKTHIAASIIKAAVAKGKRVLFLAPRRELIYQASGKLTEAGIQHGVIMAGEPMFRHMDVQVASFDTLHARALRGNRMDMPEADLVIVDEVHLSIAKTKREIIAHYPDAIVIGLTATPARGDGRGLGEIYDDLILSCSISDLTEQGHLAPVRYFAPRKPDLAGLKKGADGDYILNALGERMDKADLIGDVVSNWRRIAPDRQTVVFCVNRAHSRHVCAEFISAGYVAEHLDGETPKEERREILARVASGETQVLCNVFVATFGLDIPILSCAVLARPTRNITLYLQTCGRVLRICEGKDDAIIIDHAGAIEEHGYLDDDHPWSLDATEKVTDRKKKADQERQEPKEIVCKNCRASFKGSRKCPECGHEMIPPSKPIPTHQADLEELVREKKRANKNWDTDRKAAFFGGLKKYAQDKGYSPGWAAHKYREKFSVWPNAHKNAPAIEPNADVQGWIKHMAIKRRASA